jgi:hypothetical protein
MKFFTWFLIVVFIGVGVWVYIRGHRIENGTIRTDTVMNEKAQGKAQQEIRAQVEAFGGALQKVSLLSPTAATDIERIYAPYITTSLRAQWSAHPETALGRMTSSPWPDHIDVVDIEAMENGMYTVRAVLTYLTSEELEHGGDAGTATLSLLVVSEDDTWKIDNVSVVQQNNPSTPRDDNDRPQLQ